MRRDLWTCNVCHAENHVIDAECQFCECGGADCKRNNCADPAHGIADQKEHLRKGLEDGIRRKVGDKMMSKIKIDII